MKQRTVLFVLIAGWILYPVSALLGSYSEPSLPQVSVPIEKTTPTYQIPGLPNASPDELIQELEIQSSKQPNVAEISYQLGLVYAQQGHLDQAIQALQTALKIDPHHIQAWNNLGANLNDQGKFDDALKAYQSATESDPRNGDAWSGLACILMELHRLDEGGAALAEGFKYDPNSRRLWNSLGMLRLNQSRFSDATDAFRHATEIDPNYAIGWCNLGLAQFRLNNFDEAIASDQKATEINPKFVQAWNNLAEACEKGGPAAKSDDAASHSVALSYNQPKTWAFIANHSFLHGKWEDAVEQFSIAVDQLGMNNAEAIAEYGEAAAHIAHFADADKLIDQAQKMDPTSSVILEHLGCIRFCEAKVQEAYGVFVKTLQINPRDNRAWDGLGNCYEVATKYDDAVKCYQKALETYADDFPAWKGLVRCYQHLGKSDEAAKASEKVSQLMGVPAPQ